MSLLFASIELVLVYWSLKTCKYQLLKTCKYQHLDTPVSVELQGAFSKFQDYVLNTTVNRVSDSYVTFQHILPVVHCNVPMIFYTSV